MKSRILLLSLFLILASSVLSCIQIENKSVKMRDKCKTMISDKNSIMPCCCGDGHKDYTVNDYVETPVFKSRNIVEITFYIKQNKGNNNLYTDNEISTFYTPLKTIRLLI